MEKQYERVNEPMTDKLDRAAKSYAAGRIDCSNPKYIASQLQEIANRIRKSHSDKIEGVR